MLDTLDIILIVTTLCSVIVSLQFIFLRRRDKRINQVFGNTSPDTFKALDELEKLRRRPDEIFYIRLVQDLKSPLTMLSGPVEQLGNSASLSPDDQKMLQIMGKAVGKMERIVGQLSDFSQEEFSLLRLSLNRDFPISAQIKKDMEYFQANAQLLGITMENEAPQGDMRIPLDVEKFESIFHNLLYGALKFVFRGGYVSVRTGSVSADDLAHYARVDREGLDDSYFMLNVFHAGETLTEDSLEAIFGKEYYYLDARAFAGVGLYYVRTLVDTHKGFIWASNAPDGSGVNFTLALPSDENAYYPEDFAVETAGEIQTPRLIPGLEQDMKVIMVVEEDTDLRDYLGLILQGEYTVKCYASDSDAQSAIAQGLLPDLIIADSMNASGDALELCRGLRNGDLTRRLPFILITRDKKGKQEIEALEAGVDVMLEQPLKPATLNAHIKSLLRRQEHTDNRVTEEDDEMLLPEGDLGIVSEEDRLFFDTLGRVIRENAANPNLTVPVLCEMLHVSRTKLYNKIRKIINVSPKRFIHEYRLKIASQMLEEGHATVSEVAEATGFNSASYFSKAFRKRYGVMPSDVRK